MRALLAFLLFCSFAFGETAQPNLTKEETQAVLDMLDKSPSMVAYKKQVKGKIAVHFEDKAADFVEVGVGQDFPEQWSRSMTFRVYQDGTIAQQGYDQDKEQIWILEYKPEVKGAKKPEQVDQPKAPVQK